MRAVPVLVVTGPVGVGKSAVASAASNLLEEAGVNHALVDMDWLRWLYPKPEDDPFRAPLGEANLAAIWANYRDAGAERLILADVIESRGALAAYRSAVPGADLIVARLRAEVPTIERRLERRESGENLTRSRRRAIELSRLMEANGVGDVLLRTENRTAHELAREMLRRTGWIGTK